MKKENKKNNGRQRSPRRERTRANAYYLHVSICFQSFIHPYLDVFFVYIRGPPLTIIMSDLQAIQRQLKIKSAAAKRLAILSRPFRSSQLDLVYAKSTISIARRPRTRSASSTSSSLTALPPMSGTSRMLFVCHLSQRFSVQPCLTDAHARRRRTHD